MCFNPLFWVDLALLLQTPEGESTLLLFGLSLKKFCCLIKQMWQRRVNIKLFLRKEVKGRLYIEKTKKTWNSIEIYNECVTYTVDGILWLELLLVESSKLCMPNELSILSSSVSPAAGCQCYVERDLMCPLFFIFCFFLIDSPSWVLSQREWDEVSIVFSKILEQCVVSVQKLHHLKCENSGDNEVHLFGCNKW